MGISLHPKALIVLNSRYFEDKCMTYEAYRFILNNMDQEDWATHVSVWIDPEMAALKYDNVLVLEEVKRLGFIGRRN
jgi:hypothetical protein